ncbi:hypothetical protein [Pseudarthrobacter defluvii]|uniref:hypothetical protein n=1 Tax=Pseudarthrobacter defluvii TaxID=410837 RepID=UPI0027D80A19|nr:hypothetical protein [Pseudarthrobacter defluvii]
MSDLIQFLSDRDASPWAELVGFVPDEVSREVREANNADLLLTSGSRSAVVEVKLGHLMSDQQQEKYEALTSRPDLYLAALASDKLRLRNSAGRWSFLSLSDLVHRWEFAEDELACRLASEAAGVLRTWDQMISAVFEARSEENWLPLSALNQKFLARVVTRQIAHELKERDRMAWAGVTSGGGLPIIQGWTPIRGEGNDRCFMAEVRWWETKPGGELRFGVDFDARPDNVEDEEVRRAAYDLAISMDSDIEFASLHAHLQTVRPDLAELLSRDKRSRPEVKGDWEKVIVHGMRGAPLDGRKSNTRRTVTPGFFGDGALRFQAIVDIDFDQASAGDLTELIDATLAYLTAREPEAALSS